MSHGNKSMGLSPETEDAGALGSWHMASAPYSFEHLKWTEISNKNYPKYKTALSMSERTHKLILFKTCLGM